MASNVIENLNTTGLIDKLIKNQVKYAGIKESKSLISIYGKNVFVWHDAGSCILTAEINSSDPKRNNCKTLTLTNPPVFEVECILFNQTGSLLALNGRNGVMVYEVPWRYGKFSSSNSKDDNISGRSWNIAEYFFVCSNRIGVVQIAWHPGSSSNTHLTVLSTDNYIRTYDVTDPQTPQQVVCLSTATSNSFLSSDSKISFSTCLGENAVSFDFGPPECMQVKSGAFKLFKATEDVIIWPIYVLHGNGDVYLTRALLIKERNQPPPKVIGPLTMYPPSEDNYGYDACSLLCLHSTPNCVVIATANGVIYHSIVLENCTPSEKEAQMDSPFGYEVPDTSDATLYVFESVELPLSLNEEQDDVLSHPIRLYKDISSHSKYHCTHASGLHSVAVPFLEEIEKNIASDGKIVLGELKPTSIVEHLLCTKPFSQMEPIPVLGIATAVLDCGVSMVCLLASWEFMCLPLVSSYFSSPPTLLSEKKLSSGDSPSALVPALEHQIDKALQRSVCCPYLKSVSLKDENNSTPQQWIELLYNVTQRLKEDYVYKLNTTQALLKSRVKVLKQQKEYQLNDINRILQEKETLKSSAEKITGKYEEANANQLILLNRMENVVRKAQKHIPYLSKAEVHMKGTLVSYEDKLKHFSTSIDIIRKKLKHQQDKKKDSEEPSENKATMTETQTKHVRELLMQQGESITDLKKKIASLKMETGI